MALALLSPPVAQKIPHELTKHGDTRIDNYFWMKDREDPKVTEYLTQENEYLLSMINQEEQDALFEEIKSRIVKDDQSVPYKHRGYWYWKTYNGESEYPVYHRKPVDDDKEEIMLDVNVLAEGKEFCQVKGVNVSPNNRYLAYGMDTVGRRLYTIYVKDLSTGEIVDTFGMETTGGTAWCNDSQTFFYVLQDPTTLRDYKVVRHILGTSSDEDKEIYHEKDEMFDISVNETKSSRWIIISSDANITDEYLILNADDPLGEFKLFSPRVRGVEYCIYHYGDHFYIRTNWDAVNFRLMRVSTDNTSMENWEEVIPHREETLLEDVTIFEEMMVLTERSEGLTKFRVLSDKVDYYIQFPEETYSVWDEVNMEFSTNEFRFCYQSLTTPKTTFQYNTVTKEMVILKEQPVNNFNKNNYLSERVFATAEDGKQVAISLVYHKNFPPSPKTALFQYGYGSYGSTIDPYFASWRLSLLDRGVTFAIAHVRGSEYFGRKWYNDGKLLNKRNTFTDFIACSRCLIESNYTSSNKLFAYGGSAGGLLMGSILNMSPDLYKGVIADVPFVDALTTMLDDTIPLTVGEYDEWGNPNEKEFYDYIKSYSPYDNVGPMKYPNILVLAGLHDSQVQYWEPAKWVAKLRDNDTSENKILLRTDMDCGHGGASGRFKFHKETAVIAAFVLKCLTCVS